jgi:Glyoxalase/Bleomycin resistance protein/Dioxygenase superfamily
MRRIWHVGMAVPDLEKGMHEMSEIFDITWRPIYERQLHLKDGDGKIYDVVCRVTFSFTTPFALEIWQAVPGTPLATPEGSAVHHIGYWAEDMEAESARLTKLGYPPFMSEIGLYVHRGPGNVGLEPCDLTRDRPTMRDLFPAESSFHSVPDLSAVETGPLVRAASTAR